jgi:hypothetical protein
LFTGREAHYANSQKKTEELKMKRILTGILIAVGIAGPFVAGIAGQGHRMIANIPFTFIANGTAMPAGRYQLTQWGAGQSAFELQNVSGRAIFVALAIREEGKPNQASITFACHAKQCVLAKIAPPASLAEYSLGRDSVERTLRHTFGMASMVSIKLAAH